MHSYKIVLSNLIYFQPLAVICMHHVEYKEQQCSLKHIEMTEQVCDSPGYKDLET